MLIACLIAAAALITVYARADRPEEKRVPIRVRTDDRKAPRRR